MKGRVPSLCFSQLLNLFPLAFTSLNRCFDTCASRPIHITLNKTTSIDIEYLLSQNLCDVTLEENNIYKLYSANPI